MAPQTLHNDEELQLLLQLKAGEERAFTRLYEQHSLIIYRKLKKMIRIDSLAAELLQDVFVKLWDKRHLIDPEKPLRAYLYLIAQNLVYDQYRKAGREERLQHELRQTFSEEGSPVEESLLFKETSELLEKAIAHLPAQQQAVFRLCKLDGRSYEEAAQELGLSVSTINGHIVRGTKSVKRYLLQHHQVGVQLVMASAITGLARLL